MGLRCCQRGQMRLVIETGQGIVGLRLQIGRLDPAFGLCRKRTHPRPVDQVGHQRRDEDRLARARKTGDTQPDHRLEECPGQRIAQRLDAPRDPIRQIRDCQRPASFSVCGQDRHDRAGSPEARSRRFFLPQISPPEASARATSGAPGWPGWAGMD
jgi:hypothetical protein